MLNGEAAGEAPPLRKPLTGPSRPGRPVCAPGLPAFSFCGGPASREGDACHVRLEIALQPAPLQGPRSGCSPLPPISRGLGKATGVEPSGIDLESPLDP